MKSYARPVAQRLHPTPPVQPIRGAASAALPYDSGYLLLQVLPSAVLVGRSDAHIDLVVYFSDLEVDDEPSLGCAA